MKFISFRHLSHMTKRGVARHRLIPFCLGFVLGLILGELILWGPAGLVLYLSALVAICILIAPSIVLPATIAGLVLAATKLLPVYNPLDSPYSPLDAASNPLPYHLLGLGRTPQKRNERSSVTSSAEPARKVRAVITLAGVVERPPRYRNPGQVEFVIRSTDGRRLLCKGMDLPWRNASAVKTGDQVRFKGGIIKIHPGPSLLSYERGLLRDGISAKCNLKWMTIIEKREFNARAWIQGFGDVLRKGIERFILPSTHASEAANLFFALTLGVRDRVSQETEIAFRNLGLSHLLVLSGYQISLVFGMAYWFVFHTLGRLCPILVSGPHIIATGVAFFAASLLTVISGLEKPALRAICAVLTAQVIKLQGGRSRAADQIAVTVLLLILFSGVSIIDPSLDLTLAAVIGITIGNKGSLIGRYLWSNWCASAATGIISLIWFREWSWVALLVNPLMAPILGIVPIIAFCALFLLALISRPLSLMAAEAILGSISIVRDGLVNLARQLPPPAAGELIPSAIICMSIFSVAIARRRALK